MNLRLIAIGMLSFVGLGCTHTHLRHNTVAQSQTMMDIVQQQVLDNVAMFHVDPDALPSFSVPGTATNAVNDNLNAGGALNYTRVMFNTWGLNFGGSRAMNQNWSLSPVTSPEKLEIMRCAFQVAVGRMDPCDPCVRCCELDAVWTGGPGGCCDPCRWPTPGWYHVGKWCDVPKHSRYVGEYKGTYVWVPPEGVEALTRLTLTILDYATLKAVITPQEQIVETFEYGADGIPRLKEVKVTREQDEGKYVPEQWVPGTRALYGHSGPPAVGAPPAPARKIRENFYDPIRGLINLPQ